MPAIPELPGREVDGRRSGNPGRSESRSGAGRVNSWTKVLSVLTAAALSLGTSARHAAEGLIKHHRMDLFEVCCPHDSGLSRAVAAEGGVAQRFSFWNGFDVATRNGTRRLLDEAKLKRPRHAWFSPPCDPWSTYQATTQRTPKQIERLIEKRRK